MPLTCVHRPKPTARSTHAPRRVSAWGRGVWTLAGASVECRVMSGLAATGADEACRAEQRDSAAWREPRSALSEIALMHHAGVLARIRLTRTAAERGPVLSGVCGQDASVEINKLRLVERANAHTPPDAEALGGVECGHWPKPAWSAERCQARRRRPPTRPATPRSARAPGAGTTDTVISVEPSTVPNCPCRTSIRKV